MTEAELTLPVKRTTERGGVRLADYVAMLKIEGGDWRVDTMNGEVYHRITNKPLKFSRPNIRYDSLTVYYCGMKVRLYKHRIVYLAGHCDLRHLPGDLNLEVDHINHDTYDCRVINLRLIPSEENNIQLNRKFRADEVILIRERCAAGESRRKLARELGVAHTTITRMVDRECYKEIP